MAQHLSRKTLKPLLISAISCLILISGAETGFSAGPDHPPSAPSLTLASRESLQFFKRREENRSEPVLRYLPKKDGQWSVAETTNFRIHFKGDTKPIDKLGVAIEQARRQISEKWFGKAEEDWRPRCFLYLDGSGNSFKRAPHARGFTSPVRDGWRIRRYITVHAEDEALIHDVLPHEITHALVLDHFTDEIPRWANEGMAMQAETQAGLEEFRTELDKQNRRGKLFAVSTLMEMEEYPEGDDLFLYYAQSGSLVDFLTSRKEPKVMIDFLREAMKDGPEKALKKLYGFRNYADCEKRWKAFAFGEGAVPPRTYVKK